MSTAHENGVSTGCVNTVSTLILTPWVRPHTKPFSGLPLRALLSDLGSSDEAQQSTAEAVERGLHEDEARLRAQVQARLEAEKTDPSLVRPNRGVWVCTSGL